MAKRREQGIVEAGAPIRPAITEIFKGYSLPQAA